MLFVHFSQNGLRLLNRAAEIAENLMGGEQRVYCSEEHLRRPSVNLVAGEAGMSVGEHRLSVLARYVRLNQTSACCKSHVR